MKIFIKNPWLLPGLVAGLCGVAVWQATAQTFTTLYSFIDWPDGQVPEGTLALSSNTLYGTTSGGGESGSGTVFAIHTDGTGYTNLYSFEQLDIRNANSSGGYPYGDLALAGNTLYGTASSGGLCAPCGAGAGTLFEVNTDGTGFAVLHTFAGGNADGAGPYAGLRLSGNTLIGTTRAGGNSNNGTVFVLSTNGTGFAALYSFGPNGTNAYGQFTNSYQWFTNSGGALLYAGLILSGNRFYGTAASSGSFGNGTVFAMNTDGTAFTVLHEFSGPAHYQWGIKITNSDGALPSSSLTVVANTLYGTAFFGGTSGEGTVFKVNTDGSGFTTLHNFGDTIPYDEFGDVFSTNSDGACPAAGLILSANTLYGTASCGGSKGYGTIFSISFSPQLAMALSGRNIVLSWPTNVAGFDYTSYHLQSTTNLGSSAIWSTNLPGPVVVNGQTTVTNPISGTQQFFRLSQ